MVKTLPGNKTGIDRASFYLGKSDLTGTIDVIGALIPAYTVRLYNKQYITLESNSILCKNGLLCALQNSVINLITVLLQRLV